jgi:hypothetical protein
MDAIPVELSMHRSKFFNTREDWDEIGTLLSLQVGMSAGSMLNAMAEGHRCDECEEKLQSCTLFSFIHKFGCNLHLN